MELKPSNIFYSHNSIMYRFKKLSRSSQEHTIGETLDDLCNGKCKVEGIPRIRVTKKDGKWFTLDNRRLWVFHHYEAYLNSIGKMLKIYADEREYCELSYGARFTTKNGGVSIDVTKGRPGGVMVNRIKPVIPEIETVNQECIITEDHGEKETLNGTSTILNTKTVIYSSATNSENNTEISTFENDTVTEAATSDESGLTEVVASDELGHENNAKPTNNELQIDGSVSVYDNIASTDTSATISEINNEIPNDEAKHIPSVETYKLNETLKATFDGKCSRTINNESAELSLMGITSEYNIAAMQCTNDSEISAATESDVIKCGIAREDDGTFKHAFNGKCAKVTNKETVCDDSIILDEIDVNPNRTGTTVNSEEVLAPAKAKAGTFMNDGKPKIASHITWLDVTTSTQSKIVPEMSILSDLRDVKYDEICTLNEAGTKSDHEMPKLHEAEGIKDNGSSPPYEANVDTLFEHITGTKRKSEVDDDMSMLDDSMTKKICTM